MKLTELLQNLITENESTKQQLQSTKDEFSSLKDYIKEQASNENILHDFMAHYRFL
ncbi:hypothetical protein [Helicobacter muridarum]|uniref:Uncharacterized protein n=1 Tax=Helicobacter muridarum TaxID=216 RepID=A0A377PW57_9HELI|nr:hypothetical protein [Helicobacter muridarum]STQ86719.1 Uncharacterised protein [Helicobacter muridarum]